MKKIVEDLQKDLIELNKQPMANAEAIQKIKNKIHELKRNNIISALIEQGCKKNWCEQFKTEDLKDTLNKILFKSKKELTEAIILKAIEPFKHEWIAEASWWFGSSTSFKNAIYGWDCEVCHNEETDKIECIVYALKPSKEDKGHLEIEDDTLFKFEIEIEPTNWNIGQLVTPIVLEEDSPFKISTNYIVTEIKELQKEERGIKIYTLNNHIEFKYTDFEIGAFFKKVEL